MKYRRGATCQITSYEVDAPSRGSLPPFRKWMATASIHHFDPEATDEHLVPGTEVILGLPMKTLIGTGFAEAQLPAMQIALQSVLAQLELWTAPDDLERG